MARTNRRGGPETRDRIAQIASRLFVERGFDDVTVTEVGRAAGVSSVTVFKYFPKKEDLFFDRADEIRDLFLAAISGHHTRAGVLDAIRSLLLDLLDRRHPLSGVDERSIGFFRTVAQSSTLTARARHITADVQQRMRQQLEDQGFDGDAALVTAFIVAGYTRVLIETATELIGGAPDEEISAHHRSRIERLLHALDAGVL